MDRIVQSDDAITNIDLMFAMALVIGAVMMALLVIPNLSHEDNSWRITQYMAAARASDNLVQDPGSPANWEMYPGDNFSNVTKAGFLDDGFEDKVLSRAKIQAIMGTGYQNNNITWWDFPAATTNIAEKKKVARALGLEGYDFYMQLHPVGLGTDFDPNPLRMILSNRSRVPINDDTVSVIDRYVYIKDLSCRGGYVCYKNLTVHYRLNLWVW